MKATSSKTQALIHANKPPQSLEAEEAVLGAIMLEKHAIDKVVEILTPDCFYAPKHLYIYQAVLKLYDRNDPIDMITVTQQLTKMDKLDSVEAFYLAGLTQKVNSGANIEHHAYAIKESYIRREMITLGMLISQSGYDVAEDLFEQLSELDKALSKVQELANGKVLGGLKEAIEENKAKMEIAEVEQTPVTGIRTPFKELDEITCGWQPGHLIILAARPAMGKSALALMFGKHAAIAQGKKVLMFSLEMSKTELVGRLITIISGVHSWKIKSGKMTPKEKKSYLDACKILDVDNLDIPDLVDQTVRSIRSTVITKAREMGGIDLIIIDYLQLMSGEGGTREEVVSGISRGLKKMAKSEGIPLIALSQLSRAVENRGGDKRPQLSDLRESGCVTGDTLITDALSGRQYTIKELAERGDQNDIYVHAMDKNYRVLPQKMIKAFYSGVKKVYKLKTRGGKEIKASANHPFRKLTGWTRLDELKVGDAIATPREIKVTQSLPLMKKDVLLLLAHLIGDGCILPNQPYHYTSPDKRNLEAVKQAAYDLFGIKSRLVQQDNCYHLYLTSPYRLTHGKRHPITDMYNALKIKRVRAHEKVLPKALFELDDESIQFFLHHLWSTDGSITQKTLKGRKRSCSIYYSTTSKVLAHQVQHLLLRLNIRGTLKKVDQKKHKPLYTIHVYGKDEQMRFLTKVGSHGDRGDIIPIVMRDLEAIQSNTNVDTIPSEAWNEVITPAKESKGISWRKFAEEIEMSFCGSSLFKNGISRRRMNKIAGVLDSSTVSNLASSDIFWDKIESIEYVGTEDVYDATVEPDHNFVANDIIIHNSIEQDADMVMFLYRPEYYGITEDDSSNDLTNIAEVNIAKHRGGPLGRILLNFDKPTTKFSTIETHSKNEFNDYEF